jgi:hypothetical protein
MMRTRHGISIGLWPAALALVLFWGGSAIGQTASSISSNFNGTPIPAGDYIWFSAVLRPSGLSATDPVTIFVTNQTISFTVSGNPSTVPVPDTVITFFPSLDAHTPGSASTTCFGSMWQTTVPSFGLAGNTFLGGVAFHVSPGGLPGGIHNVIWQGQFSTDTPGVSLHWQWAAAVYKSFNDNCASLGVKPVDDNVASIYPNSDHAGTPEMFKRFVIGGATGGGGSNFTGSYSGTASVLPLVVGPQGPGGPQ